MELAVKLLAWYVCSLGAFVVAASFAVKRERPPEEFMWQFRQANLFEQVVTLMIIGAVWPFVLISRRVLKALRKK